MTDATVQFNGIDAATGRYLHQQLTIHDLANLAQGKEIGPDLLNELRRKEQQMKTLHLGVGEGIDPTNLSEAGWGIVCAFDDNDEIGEILEALRPLLDLRREQAGGDYVDGGRYKEFIGVDAYRRDESKSGFLARHRMGPGAADPRKVPYYLLFVGSPESIPYRFQYLLDVDYAVGRIHFDTPEQYARYATSVVRAETGQTNRNPMMAFFGVQNAADRATQSSARKLVAPLAEYFSEKAAGWSVQAHLKDNAHKADLQRVLASEDRPAFLFTASHGIGFPNGHENQVNHQGALLCQDWPGPLEWKDKEIPPEFYFSADDLGEAKLDGLIGFHFACYGAGTPKLDDYAHGGTSERKEIAPYSFMAQLPQKMLSHKDGGALAVVGHIERAWTYSFDWPGVGAQRSAFEDSILRLTKGHPIGSALEYFNERFASITVELNDEIQEIGFGKTPNEANLAGMWTASNDARSYVIIGDPAVRVCIR